MQLLDTLTVEEAAERYKVSAKTIRRRAKERAFDVCWPTQTMQIITKSADEWYRSKIVEAVRRRK